MVKRWLTKRFYSLISIVAVFSMAIPNASAQESPWSMRVHLDPILSIVKGGGNSFDIGVTAMYKVHPSVNFGFGLGIAEDWKFKSKPTIPIYLDINLDNRSKEFSPTFDFETGVGLSTDKIDYSHYYINPMVGIRYKQVGVGFGYYGGIMMGVTDAKWINGVNLRFAYYFNAQYKKPSVDTDRVMSYLKRTRFLMDFTLGIPDTGDWESPMVYGKPGRFDETCTIGLNATWLFPLSNHFYVGPTLGFRANPSDDSFSYMDLAARARYEFSQFKLMDKIYGWLQFDLGGIINTGAEQKASGVFVQPMIGGSYEVRDGKSAIELGLGYNFVNVKDDWFNYDKDKKDYFNISVGYRF